MDASATDLINPAAGSTPKGTIPVRRFSFVAQAPAGAVVRREFVHPRRRFAIELQGDSSDLPDAKQGAIADSSDLFTIASGPDQSTTAAPICIDWKCGTSIQWQPGRAVLRGAGDRHEELVNALLDFAFYEGELRTLERLVESHEDQAPADVRRAHRISRRDREHWARIGETIEVLTLARLTLSRLEPMLGNPSRRSSPLARRLMRQLSARADAEPRLASLSGRLEALEDLYEGANDRIADLRGWHNGQLLEVAIVALLVLEIVLMSADLYFRYLEIP